MKAYIEIAARKTERVFLVGAQLDERTRWDVQDSLEELAELATTAGGNFLAAWEVTFDAVPETFEIRIARFTSSTRTWTAAQTLVPTNAQNDVRFQRLGSDANGNALLLWTESDGMRTASRRFAWTRPAWPATRCG